MCDPSLHINCRRFLGNPSEAIVVEGEPGSAAPPTLDLRGSTLAGNMGGVMFGFGRGGVPQALQGHFLTPPAVAMNRGASGESGGAGWLDDNLIKDNALFGVKIHDVRAGSMVKIKGNRILKNGIRGARGGVGWISGRPGRGGVDFAGNQGDKLVFMPFEIVKDVF